MERLNGLEPSTFSLGSWEAWKGYYVLFWYLSGHVGTGVVVANGCATDMRRQSRT